MGNWGSMTDRRFFIEKRSQGDRDREMASFTIFDW